jgi:tetratricopeptide (TPR) repeat protein
MPYADRGYAFYQLEAYREAEKDFREAICKDKKLVSAHCNLGLALFGQRRYAEAIDSYKKALEVDANAPSANRTRIYLANAYYANGQFAEAITAYNLALKAEPDAPDANRTALFLALAYQGNGQIEEAKQVLNNVMQKTQPGSQEHQDAVDLLADMTGASQASTQPGQLSSTPKGNGQLPPSPSLDIIGETKP